MELTIHDLDPALTPTFAVVGAVYRVLLDDNDHALDDALAHFDGARNELNHLANRYFNLHRLGADESASFDALVVMTYLLRTWGTRTRMSRATFEGFVKLQLQEMSVDHNLYVPFWVPSVACVGLRKLLFPVITASSSGTLLAYRGLVQHLRALPEQASELAVTAVLWRIAALSDGLAPDSGGTLARINALRSRVAADRCIHPSERDLWNPLTSKFVNCRDALTHMVCDRGETIKEHFASAVDFVYAERDTLVPAATALGFAVLQDVALQLVDAPPPLRSWEQAFREHNWLDEQAGWG